MGDFVATVASIVLSIVVPLLIQRAWKRRLPPERRARMWNVATWGAALYAFGPFSMLGFLWITRPSCPYRDVTRAFTLVASLFALGMTNVVLFTATTSPAGDPSAAALASAALTLAFPVIFAAVTSQKGDRVRDAIAMGLGLGASALTTGVVAGLSYLAKLVYEALFAGA